MSGIVGGAGSKSGVVGETELDYEEGIFTPATNGDTVIDGNNSYGNYVKIGRLVTIHMNISCSSTNNSNTFQISGMPFPALDLSGTSLENSGIMGYWTNASQDIPFASPYVNTTSQLGCYFSFGGGVTNTAVMTNAHVDSTFTARITITYQTSS